MFETEQICPYTGLRSFTEEESLYFKGREEDIDQATEQLQRNKFLMLTGASGDGKSSLIYAGIIPNARAGFLKSKYTQWCVADFRPERSPFKNLCKAIARQLEIENTYTVQTELQHGFSAIVDLYKNSKRFIDTQSLSWQQADEKTKAAMKREAANLIILVDQFEEFFTNPENYHRGVPSGDANLVLNLLLETARIALEEDLPIYVVFTMRSDYIGQCAAFRGLPEYIGFSQFFVPRLNRKQLQQVIEEPAVLSGNRITRRLTERLIHDLTEGVDQLPILQHALNQIWHAADNGKEEMDLIHYAMVGGMPAHDLPDEQMDRFVQWFENLPSEIRACYHKPDLQNVLDTHTNKLYEQAAVYYRQKTGNAISDKDAKAIIKNAFICLTKIDQSRAVRNRMTLKEITSIFGSPGFGTKEVGAVLNIFREPGNTFIRPFILHETDKESLEDEDVMDITHESLIRNWEYLEQWAKEEFDNHNIFLDFEQQLNRWVESGKSDGFLLSIGPLTYFENWFQKVNPNAWWVARYLPEEIEQNKKIVVARQVLDNAHEFLKRSARKHVITRTIMRYGAKKIAAVLAIIALVTFSSFAVRNLLRQKNDYVMKTIRQETLEVANIPKLSNEFPVPPLVELLISGNMTVSEALEGIHSIQQKIKIATGMATLMVAQGRYEPKQEIFQSLFMADSLLNLVDIPFQDPKALSENLKLIHDLQVTAEIAYYYSRDEKLNAFVLNNSKRAAAWVMKIADQQPMQFSDMRSFTLALEHGINHKSFSDKETDQLLQLLSPFENPGNPPAEWVKKNFDRNNLMARGSQEYGFKFNGLFQQLAYLYASKGESAKALQCADSLLFYNQNYYQGDYKTMPDNAAHIAAVFVLHGHKNALMDFVNGYCSKTKSIPLDFYNRTVAHTYANYRHMEFINMYAGGGGQIFGNMNLCFSDDSVQASLISEWKQQALKILNGDERNFQLAIISKTEGLLRFYRQEMRGHTQRSPADFAIFRDAVGFYRQVSEEYLNRPTPVVGQSGAEIIAMPNRFLFLYPDFRTPFTPMEPRNFIFFMCSPSFIGYILEQNLFDSLYSDPGYFKYFELFFTDYQVFMNSRDWMMRDPIPFPVLEKLAAKLEERNAGSSTDLNILYLHLGNTAFENGESEKGIKYFERIQAENLLNAFTYKGFNFINTYSLELVAFAVAHLAGQNRFDLISRFMNVFRKQVNRSSVYGFASQFVMQNKGSKETAQRLFDSARAEMERIDNPAVFQPNRHQVAMALMYLDPDKNSKESYRIIKNSPSKFEAITRFSRAYALNEKLYKAKEQQPSLISSADKTGFLYEILKGYNNSKTMKPEWKKFRYNDFLFLRRFLPYINENE